MASRFKRRVETPGAREEGLGQVTTGLNVNWKVDEKLCCCVQIEDVR